MDVEQMRQQLMVNQFVLAAGCAHDQARQLLQSTQWQFEKALSIFLEEAAVSAKYGSTQYNPMCTPANTPATPPNFPETLTAFSKLSTSPSNGVSHPDCASFRGQTSPKGLPPPGMRGSSHTQQQQPQQQQPPPSSHHHHNHHHHHRNTAGETSH